MKINENIKIIGKNVILIPYEEKHVEKYHKWMQNQETLELTGSETLTLEEEYSMQKSWRNDEDKCTFLILDKNHYDRTSNEIESLIGDTNLFVSKNSDETIAEAEIMIGELSARRKGFGWESMLLMFKYGIDNLNIQKYFAKIKISNVNSIKMFKNMHFQEVSKSMVFSEYTFECNVTSDWWLNWLKHSILEYQICDYL